MELLILMIKSKLNSSVCFTCSSTVGISQPFGLVLFKTLQMISKVNHNYLVVKTLVIDCFIQRYKIGIIQNAKEKYIWKTIPVLTQSDKPEFTCLLFMWILHIFKQYKLIKNVYHNFYKMWSVSVWKVSWISRKMDTIYTFYMTTILNSLILSVHKYYTYIASVFRRQALPVSI